MRRTTAILAGVLLAAVTACSGAGTTADDDAAQPTPSVSGEIPVDPDAGGEPAAEGDQEPAQPSQDAGPEITIVGLPAGGNDTDAVGDGWCGVVNNNATPPPGVWLRVVEIRTAPSGLDTGVPCPQEPACLGTTLDDAHTSCVVGLVPPNPSAESVAVDLVVRVECTVPQDCVDFRDSVAPASWAMPNPDPDAASSTDDEPGDGVSTEDPGESPGDGTEESGDGTTESDDDGAFGETDDETDGGRPGADDDGAPSGSGAEDESGEEDAP